MGESSPVQVFVCIIFLLVLGVIAAGGGVLAIGGAVVVTIGGVFAFGFFFGGVCAESAFDCEVRAIRLNEQRLRHVTRFEVFVQTDKGDQWGAFLDSVPGVKVYEALRRVACTGRSFSVRDMSGVLSRTEFELLRDELVERGFLVWRDPLDFRQGVEWTRPGSALLRSVEGVKSDTALPSPACASVRRVSSAHTSTHIPAHPVGLFD